MAITEEMYVEEMYAPILACLDVIASIERNWDSKTSTAAYGLMKSITDHVFIVAFQVVRHFFGYIKGLSTKLQGSTLDVIQGYEMVSSVIEVLKSARVCENEWAGVFQKSSEIAEKANNRKQRNVSNRCSMIMLETSSPKQHALCDDRRIFFTEHLSAISGQPYSAVQHTIW